MKRPLADELLEMIDRKHGVFAPEAPGRTVAFEVKDIRRQNPAGEAQERRPEGRAIARNDGVEVEQHVLNGRVFQHAVAGAVEQDRAAGMSPLDLAG